MTGNEAAILRVVVTSQGMTEATAGLKAVDKAGQDASTRGVKAIETASKVGSVAVLGLAAGAVKLAGDYQSSMNTLQAVSGATGAQMKQLGALAVKLGADTKLPGTSAQDAAEAMTEMTKAGLSLKDTMAGARSVLVLSAAAQISNADAAEIASNALNTFKLSGKDVTMVTDELANTANASSVEIKDVADATKQAGAVFSGFQGPVLGAKGAMTELNVAIGLLGNAGIKGSDAGTSLKQALLQLTGPAQKTKNMMRDLYLQTGGSAEAQRLFQVTLEGSTKTIRDKAETALEKLQGATKGAGDIAYDAAGKMRSLPEIIKLVSAATKNMTQEQRNATITQIFGADATRSIIALMQAGPAAWDKMSAAVTKQGSAQKLAESKMKGFKGSLEAAKSSAETLGITFGTMLLPPLTSFVKTMTGLLGVMGSHQTVTLVAIGTLGTLSIAVYTITKAVKLYEATVAAFTVVQGLATGAITAMRDACILTRVELAALAVVEGVMTVATQAWTAVQWLLNAALDANPVSLLIIAIGALVAGVILAYKHSETFRDIVNGAFNAIKAVATPVVNWLSENVPKVFKAIKTVASDVFDWLKSNWPLVLGVLTGPIGLFVVAVTKYRGQVIDAFEAMPHLIADAVKALPGALISLGGWLLDRMVDGVKAEVSVISDVAGWLKNRLVDYIELEIKAFTAIGTWIIDTLVGGIKASAGAIGDAASWLKDQVVGAVKKAFGISSPSKEMATLGGHLASGLIKGLVGGDVMGFVKSHLGGVAGVAGSVLGGVAGKIAGLFGGGKGGALGGSQLQAVLTAALQMRGQYSAANLAALTRQTLSESGGNPRAINLTDINAQRGDPSKGLLQLIAGNFSRFRSPDLPNDVYNPLANAYAAIGYMLATYGHIVGTGHAYASGTASAAAGYALVGENGPEIVRFNGGERVWSNHESAAMMGGGGGVQVIFADGMGWLEQFMEVKMANRDRAAARAYAAGVAR